MAVGNRVLAIGKVFSKLFQSFPHRHGHEEPADQTTTKSQRAKTELAVCRFNNTLQKLQADVGQKVYNTNIEAQSSKRYFC